MNRALAILTLAALAACSRTPAQEAAYQRRVRDEIYLQDFLAARRADSIQRASYAVGLTQLHIKDSLWNDSIARATQARPHRAPVRSTERVARELPVPVRDLPHQKEDDKTPQ